MPSSQKVLLQNISLEVNSHFVIDSQNTVCLTLYAQGLHKDSVPFSNELNISDLIYKQLVGQFPPFLVLSYLIGGTRDPYISVFCTCNLSSCAYILHIQ